MRVRVVVEVGVCGRAYLACKLSSDVNGCLIMLGISIPSPFAMAALGDPAASCIEALPFAPFAAPLVEDSAVGAAAAVRGKISLPTTLFTLSITSLSRSFSALKQSISERRLAVAPFRSWSRKIWIVRSSSAMCVFVFSRSERWASRSIALLRSLLSCSPKQDARLLRFTTGAMAVAGGAASLARRFTMLFTALKRPISGYSNDNDDDVQQTNESLRATVQRINQAVDSLLWCQSRSNSKVLLSMIFQKNRVNCK